MRSRQPDIGGDLSLKLPIYKEKRKLISNVQLSKDMNRFSLVVVMSASVAFYFFFVASTFNDLSHIQF